jgi:hypothetical protein
MLLPATAATCRVLLRGVQPLISLHLSVRCSGLGSNRYGNGSRVVAGAVGESQRGQRDAFLGPALGVKGLGSLWVGRTDRLRQQSITIPEQSGANRFTSTSTAATRP